MDSPRRDRSNETITRAITRLMARGHRLSRRYNIDVYIAVRRGLRNYDFNSTEDPNFPIPVQDLVSLVPGLL